MEGPRIDCHDTRESSIESYTRSLSMAGDAFAGLVSNRYYCIPRVSFAMISRMRSVSMSIIVYAETLCYV